MESPESTGSAAGVPTVAVAALSPWQRMIAVFARPSEAFVGLRDRAQWWFPLLIVSLVGVAVIGAIYERAFLPMITSQWEERVASGEMPAESYDRAVAFMSGPAGVGIFLGQQVVATIILQLISALGVWFGVSFILGRPFRYRWALEVVSWSSLVTIPATMLTATLAYVKQDWQSAHVGFGILLPEPDRPTKLLTALGVFLDGIGPLALWFVAVMVIGAAAMSGAKRQSAAWVVGGLYLVLLVVGSALASMQVPSS